MVVKWVVRRRGGEFDAGERDFVVVICLVAHGWARMRRTSAVTRWLALDPVATIMIRGLLQSTPQSNQSWQITSVVGDEGFPVPEPMPP